jgi:dCTP deaminase
MILSNVEILDAINVGAIRIEPLAGRNPSDKPFNTSAVDLRLDPTITVPRKSGGVSYRLDDYDKAFMELNGDSFTITNEQPYSLEPGKFILGRTKEIVDFPIQPGQQVYAARVEGKSSHARRGLLIHFTAPTIHSAFEGPITLEIINLGATPVLLLPNIYICQLIIEKVSGTPQSAPNQFSKQTRPSGV